MDKQAQLNEALLSSLREGHLDIAEYLLNKGANPNLKTGMGTPLLEIYLHTIDTKNVVELLLKHGADANVESRYSSHGETIKEHLYDCSKSKLFLFAKDYYEEMKKVIEKYER